MSKAKFNLVVVAHPDDETIFFGSLLLAYRRRPWHVICVTDGNADQNGEHRRQQWQNACKALRAQRFEQWSYPDIFEQRLDVTKLCHDLQKLPTPVEIYTHGILGEYGHPHHQDVCIAVHRAFHHRAQVFSSAYNTFPSRRIRLTHTLFKKKCEILSANYFDETKRFAHWLPATSEDGFLRAPIQEVERLYKFWLDGQPVDAKELHAYRWFAPYLPYFRQRILVRPF